MFNKKNYIRDKTKLKILQYAILAVELIINYYINY